MLIFKSFEQIQISDLMGVRASYSSTSAQLQAALHRLEVELSEKHNRLFFVGMDSGGDSVAYAQLILLNADNDSDLADGVQVAHIHDLRVRFDLQGKGFGKVMMNSIEDAARLRGLKSVTLGVDNWNTRAIRFYEELSYTKFKEVPGRTEDEVCFYLRKSF